MISPVDLRTLEVLEQEMPSRGEDEAPAGRLSRWQLSRVRRLIAYLRAKSTFYAKSLSGVEPGSIDSPSALARLPFTCGQDVRADPAAFLCIASRDVRRVATIASSGSTGEPKRFSFTANDLEKTLDFFAYGMRSLTGRGKQVTIMLSAKTRDSIASLLVIALDRIGASAIVHGHPHDIEAAAEAAGGAHCLIGMPSEILHLCRAHPHLRPESVLLTADYVPQSAVRDIERTWQCKTYSHYGMTETGYGLAVQCYCGGSHHLRHADVLTEIVDPASGAPLPPGEVGEVVLTTFGLEAMPLLRYRTGDSAFLDVSVCPCGGTLPRLGRVGGRLGGRVDLGDMTTSQEELDEVVYAAGAVRNYRARLLQGADGAVLSLTIDADERMARDAFEQTLRERLTPRIAFTYEQLPPTAGGRKRRIARPGGALQQA